MSIGLNANNDGTGSIQIGGSDAINISTGLNVGIGTASPVYPLDIYDATSAVARTYSDTSAINIAAVYSNSNSPQFQFYRYRNTSASPTVVSSGDITGRLQFFGFDGTTLIRTAEIRSDVDGTPGTNDMPGRLVFLTTADGASASTERMRIDSSGNINIATTGARITGDFSNATVANRVMFQNNVTDAASRVAILPNGTSTSASIDAFNNSNPTNASLIRLGSTSTDCRVEATITGTGTLLPMTFYTGGFERMRIDTSGNVLVTNAAGLGYGTGSGGTVTQATSKATAVTLNKPTGQITMNGAALNANTTVVFTVTNSLCAFVDTVSINHRNGASYNVWVVPGIGSFDVYLRNITAGSLSDAVVLNFSIIKGATS